MANIVQQMLFPEELKPTALSNEEKPKAAVLEVSLAPTGRYDFDLAEFPFFHFDKNPDTPLKTAITYTDSITGNDGLPIKREWKVYPSAAYGFGGPTTQLVLYDLLQLYVEQGCKGNQIQFGTLYNLLQRRGIRTPSTRDYQRLRRDIEILCSCRFHCKNAFWDRERQAYVDMNWQLFNSVFYFKDKPYGNQTEMPFGFIEVSSVLQQIARTRGFYTLGFPAPFFYKLKPLEQRLAIYLAKKFMSQPLHQRFVDDLAKALPIDAKRPDNVRAILKNAANGLIEKAVPFLATFELRKSREGKWVAVFHRRSLPRVSPPPIEGTDSLPEPTDLLVRRLSEISGQPEDWRWWRKCAEQLGPVGIEAAIQQFEEASRLRRVERPGALLTKILKDVAGGLGLTIGKSTI
ncbi:MAG TPA: hypothetical protein VHW24_18355 [Bryobacteraceae bacterium]|nr:hypothetical protein [Bryobacteraceae bacterium]